MIKRESLQKKLAIVAVAGMLMLLLAASCVAQTPLEMSESENCTNCSANAFSSPNLGDAAQETELANLSVSQVLEPAELISPSGILKTGKPTYTWVGVDDCQYYCLVVNNSHNNIVLKQWYDAADFLSATCSVTPLQILEPGDYTWSIQCWNCSGSQLSQEMDFTVCTSSTYPGKATLVSPKGTIGSKNPTFVWNAVNGCTQYYLKVADVTKIKPIFVQRYDVEDVLSEQVCSITPELNLSVPGNYRWWVQTANCKGNGSWSNFMSFRYVNVPPGRSTPISPQGLISTCTPTFIWTAASAASQYHLQVVNVSDSIVADEWFDADVVTKGLRCSAFLTTILPDDDVIYFWRIQASNDAGNGSWSSYKYFETVCAFKPAPAKKKAKMG